MFFGVDLLDVDMAILEDLCETISVSLQGIKDLDWLEEVGKGVQEFSQEEKSQDSQTVTSEYEADDHQSEMSNDWGHLA